MTCGCAPESPGRIPHLEDRMRSSHTLRRRHQACVNGRRGELKNGRFWRRKIGPAGGQDE